MLCFSGLRLSSKMESLYVLILYFGLCSLLGRIIEVIFGIIKKDKFAISGFSRGPFIMLYGLVGISIYFFSTYFADLFLPVKLIILFMIPLIIEYLSSFILEKTFNIRGWDYSELRFNLHGRISLVFGLYWSVLVLIGVFVIQPNALRLLNSLSFSLIQIFTVLFVISFFAHIIFSIRRYHLIWKKAKGKLVKLR